MAADENLEFNIFARLREDGFAKASKAAAATSADVKELSDRLTRLDKQSAEARVALKGDKEAIAQLDKLDLKLVTVGNRLSEPEVKLQGAARSQAEMAALELSLDKLGAKAEKTTGLLGPGAGLSGMSGMGALIAAGVALSPIIATVATGTAGFGLAAAGAISPILKAAQATGGLQANMAKLNPEQQKLAGSILGLGKQYDAFQKALQPEVLSVFGKGVQIAGHLLHDVQPIAAATGKALGSMLDAVDKEFQSGTWQKFFAFMAKSAGPDIKLISDNFISLMNVLPGVLQELQPLAVDLLSVTNAGLKLVGFLDKTHILLPAVGAAIGLFVGGPVGAAIGGLAGLGIEAIGTNHKLGQMPGQFVQIGKSVYAATPQLARFGTSAEGATKASDAMAAGFIAAGQGATAAKQPVFNMATAVDTLTASMNKNIGVVLTLQGDQLAYQQQLHATTKQLESNSAGLKGNSDNAIANRVAVHQLTADVVTAAESQLNLGHNLQGASARIQDQIHWLQLHGDKSKFATDEIHALRVEEDKLKAAIRQKLEVSAEGQWHVIGGGQVIGPGPGGGNRLHTAQGAFVTGGIPNRDSVPIMAMPGELVIPTRMVSAGLVDHLRGMIPGFAAGGVVSNYSGSVGGMSPWLAREDAATLRAVEVATAAATAAGIKSAQSAASGGFGGIGSGGSGTNVQIGQQMAASIGWTGNNWLFLKAGWNEESGWRTNAFNVPGDYSHAYGIPQAYPGTKMAAAGADWKTNPHTQIRWGLGYIRGTYGSPTGVPLWSANGPLPGYKGYADGGVVGGDGKTKPVDPQRKKWLAQLARDVKVLEEDQKHAVKRRKILRHAVEIDELWFLTHPGVRKHGIGFDEHERALRNDQRRLSHFNKRESDKEKDLAQKIAILRDLTGFPKGAKYGGPGSPAPDPGAGAGAGDGGAGGGTTSAPTGPPPIPPPPMPEWMVAAGLGGSGAAAGGFTFPAQMAPRSMPEPIAYAPPFGGSRSMGGGGGEDLGAVIAELRAMHQGIVGAVGMVAPGTARGFDRSQNSMAARVAGRFT